MERSAPNAIKPYQTNPEKAVHVLITVGDWRMT
jgi:hypothetical protein